MNPAEFAALESAEFWRLYLLRMGRAVRARVQGSLRRGESGLAEPVAEEGGDVIFRLDRRAEEAMLDFLAETATQAPPFLLVAEGVHHGRMAVGGGPPRFRVLCDPIDGSRGLMYDKRAGWFLAGVAVEQGDEATRLSGVFASVMVELPTAKQGWSDEFSAVRGAALEARRIHLASGDASPLGVHPSSARTLRGGFAHVANFFPGAKRLAADLMERITLAACGPVEPGRGNVFDDQYISTGGQMAELMMGRDRFCCDLRPLFDQIQKQQGAAAVSGLTCHPYDAAGLLAAQQSGVLITDGFGAPLDARMNVGDPVHWCGFANSTLRALILPEIQRWLREQGLSPA